MTAVPSDWSAIWAQFRPDHEALYEVATDRRWTWRQLHAEATARAALLWEQGVRPGDRVGVLAQNRAETLFLLFACAQVGAILVPFNWRLTLPELEYQLQDCAPKVLFCDAGNPLPHPHLSLEEPVPARDFTGPGSTLQDPWILMYTSGSSGRPKGALLTHQQVQWNAATTILACDLTPDSSTLTFTPLFHTGGMNCLTTPLLYRGGRVVLASRFDVGETLHLIRTERVSNLMGVPTIYQMLADHPDFDGSDLSCVRDALCGGAPLSLALLERYLSRNIPLRQGFGLTEVGPNCFSMPPHEVRRKLGSVGLPIHLIFAKLVRPDGTACGANEPGELVLAGPLVCGGYWNNPKATAESIRDGWFHTGDMLARDEEGFYYVRGRIKEMFISGGENVYPAEVEATILNCPGVAQVAVIGVPDARWGEVGRAFVEPQPGATVDEAAVLTYLNGRLARYKIPKQVVVMPVLPRTGSGKIDKVQLKGL